MLREFSLLVSRNDADRLSDALVENGAYSVTVEDADAGNPDERPIYGEPGMESPEFGWNRSRLKVLTGADFDFNEILKKACGALSIKAPDLEAIVEVPDNDWVRITQAQFNPIQISKNLWIVPTWHATPDQNAVNIRLDPGVAFGTGAHPTTRLCLEWLASHSLTYRSVLDYGCGSGILAIAAAKLGASPVIGTDIDPQAVEAARLNAKTNDCDAVFVLPEKLPEGTFNIVIANILSNPLRILAPALISRVKEKGYLVLSGILETQAEELANVYNTLQPKLKMANWKTSDGWVCLTGHML